MVRDALARFMEAHGMDQAVYRARRFNVKLGPLTLPFPNPRYLPFHDLHHVVLDAPPTFWGEVQVSAFELRSGPPTALIMLLCVGALLLAAPLNPRRVWRWLAHYAGTRNAYRAASYEALLACDLGDLRREMRLGP